MVFTLRDVALIAGIVVSGFTLAGAVGGAYVLNYRVEQAEKRLDQIAAKQGTHEQADAQQDLILVRLTEKIDSVDKRTAQIAAVLTPSK